MVILQNYLIIIQPIMNINMDISGYELKNLLKGKLKIKLNTA